MLNMAQGLAPCLGKQHAHAGNFEAGAKTLETEIWRASSQRNQDPSTKHRRTKRKPAEPRAKHQPNNQLESKVDLLHRNLDISNGPSICGTNMIYRGRPLATCAVWMVQFTLLLPNWLCLTEPTAQVQCRNKVGLLTGRNKCYSYEEAQPGGINWPNLKVNQIKLCVQVSLQMHERLGSICQSYLWGGLIRGRLRGCWGICLGLVWGMMPTPD